MVGVPRSKSCITCHKRRKGCDKRQPSCGQCERLGLECAGYARERVFVYATKQSSIVPFYKASTIALPATLARSAYEERCLGIFWSAYLPNGRAPASDVMQATIGGWTNTARALYFRDETVKKAVLALCLTNSGKLEGKKFMSEEGLRFYTSALRDMSVALKKPSKAKENSILTAARLFSLYEIMYGADGGDNPAQEKSWTAHNSGELAILIARGPEQYTEGHAHQLFIDGRQHLTVLAMRARKRSILSDPAWKTIPWSRHPKTQKDSLLNILVDMPTLYEELDILRSCDNPDEEVSHRKKLLDDCWLCDKQLTEWYATSRHKELRPFNGEDILLPAKDLVSAHLMSFYWATCIVLYSTLREAVGPDIQLPERADVKAYCQKIIRIVPIFFHPAVGNYRTHLAGFPIAIALMHLGAFPLEERVVEQSLLVDTLSRPEGIEMRKFFKSLELLSEH